MFRSRNGQAYDLEHNRDPYPMTPRRYETRGQRQARQERRERIDDTLRTVALIGLGIAIGIAAGALYVWVVALFF